jgi:hypothetical protein
MRLWKWKWKNAEEKKKFIIDSIIAVAIILIGIIAAIFIN